MAVFNLGSINIDYFYTVAHLPTPGETLSASGHQAGLGGKGANQSIAAANGGAKVVHIGAVGPDADWAITKMRAAGVDINHIARLNIPTGHAVINVDPTGENSIVIHSSANMAQDKGAIDAAMLEIGPDDILLLQNETNHIAYTANLAQQRGARVIYSAAPFDADAVRAVLPDVDYLVVNQVEARQLSAELGLAVQNMPVAGLLITEGNKGASFYAGGEVLHVAAFPVLAIDTTGAGDTYIGLFAAALNLGRDIKAAMKFAAAGAAIQVTRKGAAKAIPTAEEITAFLAERDKEQLT